MGGSIIAENDIYTTNSSITFKQSDPITGSERQTDVAGIVGTSEDERKDIGALGTSVPSQEPEEFPMPNYKQGGSIGNPEFGCQASAAPIDCNDDIAYYLDGIRVTRRHATQVLMNGVAEPVRGTSGFGYWEDYEDPTPPAQPTPEDPELITVPGIITRFFPNFNFQNKNYEPLPTNLRERVIKRLDKDNGTCRRFLDAVLKNFGSDQNIEQAFDSVNNKGILLIKNLKTVSGQPADGVSSHGSKDQVALNRLPLGKTQGQSNTTINRYITRILHEIMHRKSSGEHKEMAIAASQTLSKEDLANNPLPTDKEYKKKNELDKARETYFQRLLNQNCRFDSED